VFVKAFPLNEKTNVG